MVSGKVRDGILGKLIYSTIAISAYVVTTRHDSFLFGPTTAGLTLHIALALAGIRHLFMVTYGQWGKSGSGLHRNGEHCMGCDKKP